MNAAENINVASSSFLSKEDKKWFDSMVATLRADELALETDTAPEEVKRLYKPILENNTDELLKQFRGLMTKALMSKALKMYITKVNPESIQGLKKLAFTPTNTSLKVWAEINSNDEHSENELILAEAYVNAQLIDDDFTVSSTIVEDVDNINVPSHYTLFK